jgi:hypothetical protein
MKNILKLSGIMLLGVIVLGCTPKKDGTQTQSLIEDFEIDGTMLVGYNGNGGNVIIPDGIDSIDRDVFYKKQLTSVTIPNSVTWIFDGAFFENQLVNVNIGNSVTHIGMAAFANNKLKSVIIPESVIEIGYQAFAGNQLNGNVTIKNKNIVLRGDEFSNEYKKPNFNIGD